VRPHQPSGVAELGYANSVKWEESPGMEKYRRGLYIHFQRTTPYPLLANFDAPKASVPACRRGRTNTPLQALNLLNDPAFLEAARGLSLRAALETQQPDFERRLDRAFRLVLGRPPAAPERERLRQYFDQQKGIYDRDPEALKTLNVDSADDAAWVGVSTVLLNLDEFMVRE
jgi:hypothetical protein